MTITTLAPTDLWNAERLQVAGWTTDGSVDWPGLRVLTVNLQGCPWECTSCATPELRDPRVPGRVPWRDVLDAVVARRDQLDGVLFSGGEPTRQDGLAEAMEQVRALGLAVGLHTSGSYPLRLAAVVGMADRVVVEIKAPATLYRAVTGRTASAHKAFASLRTVIDARVDLQVRTCVDPALVTPADVAALRANLAAMGVRDHVVVEMPGSSTVRATGLRTGARDEII